MNLLTLKMPRLGETMDQGIIVDWLVKIGEDFKRGDAILELETDKTVVEFPALGDGKLVEVFVQPGDIVDVGAAIASVEVFKISDWEIENNAPSPETKTPEPIVVPSPAPQIAPNNSGLRATPVARRLARQHDILLEEIKGTGRRGRIEAHDVLDARTNAPKTFMLIHGFAGDSTSWVQLETALLHAGHRVIAPDLPGHGGQNAQVCSLETCVESMVQAASEQGKNVHLIGHSFGAWIAANIAQKLDSKIASLSLIAPMGLGPEINSEFINGMAGVQDIDALKNYLELLSPKTSALSTEILTSMLSMLSDGHLKGLAHSLTQQEKQQIDLISILENLHLPVKIIIGTGDKIIPPRHAFNVPANIGVHFVDSGHMPHWDAPKTVLNIIQSK